MKFLIVGLGNMGEEYAHTRHNIGFDIADALNAKYKGTFKMDRYAEVSDISFKGRHLTLIKPSTYMNLSGKAVRYWMQLLHMQPNQVLVLVDDLAIDFGKIRIRPSGSDAGHNGLKSIQECLLTQNYPRLRFGIGNQFPKGRQVDYVLGKWNKDEALAIPELTERAVMAIETFATQGLQNAMNAYNK